MLIYTNKIDIINFVRLILTKLKNYLPYANLKKCHFIKQSCDFLSM